MRWFLYNLKPNIAVRYYPTEFVVLEGMNDKKSPTTTATTLPTTATIGPWRKCIASWMFDVVDHVQYDRNAVSIALWYIDRYVGQVLLEEERNQRRNGGIVGNADSGSQQPIKRRQFQLIAVTRLYLAIKFHGELKENDPVLGDEYDVVASHWYMKWMDGPSLASRSLPRTMRQYSYGRLLKNFYPFLG